MYILTTERLSLFRFHILYNIRDHNHDQLNMLLEHQFLLDSHKFQVKNFLVFRGFHLHALFLNRLRSHFLLLRHLHQNNLKH